MTLQALGDYTIKRLLGHGSMGTTYLAEHRLMKRPCVLKVLPPELSVDPHFVRRFENEVVALSSLNHPHIAKIQQVSKVDNYFFIVTDSLADEDGKTCNLQQYIAEKKEKLSEEELFLIARQLAAALDDAHQKTIGVEPFAHGMLKFSNVLLKPDTSELTLVLTDFGLSRIIGAGALVGRSYKAIADQLTKNIGSPWHRQETLPSDSFLYNFAFLAPEQKHPSHEKAPLMKADIYAFGVMFYYLIYGRMPEGWLGQQHRWDSLLSRCLQADPAKRPHLLMPLLDELRTPAVALEQLLEVAIEAHSLQPVLNPQALDRPTFEPDPGEIFQKELTVGKYQPEHKEEKVVTPIMTPMVIIPEGTYFRGSQQGARDEMPRHVIRMKAFAIDIHPVTNEQFVLFLEAMGGEKDAQNHEIIRLRDSRIKKYAGRLTIESGYSKHPVVGVTWYGAVAYAKWIGKRLPTEAEWEIAAYGGNSDQPFPTGHMIDKTDANFFSSDTTPVCSYSPNGYELYDMAGNVYEWCNDWYDYHYYHLAVQEPDHPQGPAQGVYRVLRGGCWKSLKDDLRCAHRHRNNPGIMNGTYGFRCAADVSS